MNIGPGFPICQFPAPLPQENKIEDFIEKMSELGVKLEEFEIELLLEGILDLSYKLTGLDEAKIIAVFQAVKELPIERLILSNNNFKSVPEEIKLLVNVKELVLSYNGLTAVPEGVWQMAHLTDLDLSNNLISSLPEKIESMLNLTSLVLDFNKLDSLPKSLENLTSLTSLSLAANFFKSIPAAICLLPNLDCLNLVSNPIYFDDTPEAPEGEWKMKEIESQIGAKAIFY